MAFLVKGFVVMSLCVLFSVLCKPNCMNILNKTRTHFESQLTCSTSFAASLSTLAL